MLNKYAAWLTKHNIDNPYSSRPKTPVALNVKTLWIPIWSGNRTASIDLNHQGCFEEKRDGETIYYGANGNCDTPYRILEIPTWWNQKQVEELAELVCKKLNKPEGYPTYRVLKADERIEVIEDTIKEIKQ